LAINDGDCKDSLNAFVAGELDKVRDKLPEAVSPEEIQEFLLAIFFRETALREKSVFESELASSINTLNVKIQEIISSTCADANLAFQTFSGERHLSQSDNKKVHEYIELLVRNELIPYGDETFAKLLELAQTPGKVLPVKMISTELTKEAYKKFPELKWNEHREPPSIFEQINEVLFKYPPKEWTELGNVSAILATAYAAFYIYRVVSEHKNSGTSIMDHARAARAAAAELRNAEGAAALEDAPAAPAAPAAKDPRQRASSPGKGSKQAIENAPAASAASASAAPPPAPALLPPPLPVATLHPIGSLGGFLPPQPQFYHPYGVPPGYGGAGYGGAGGPVYGGAGYGGAGGPVYGGPVYGGPVYGGAGGGAAGGASRPPISSSRGADGESSYDRLFRRVVTERKDPNYLVKITGIAPIEYQRLLNYLKDKRDTGRTPEEREAGRIEFNNLSAAIVAKAKTIPSFKTIDLSRKNRTYRKRKASRKDSRKAARIL
jgi:hypothetical protein